MHLAELNTNQTSREHCLPALVRQQVACDLIPPPPPHSALHNPTALWAYAAPPPVAPLCKGLCRHRREGTGRERKRSTRCVYRDRIEGLQIGDLMEDVAER